MSITYDNPEYLLNIMCGYEGTDKAHPYSPHEGMQDAPYTYL